MRHESRSPAALCIEVLPATFGDCILVTSRSQTGHSFRILVDTGPDSTAWEALRTRLSKIPQTSQRGSRRIDLFIITHIDHDHIGNVERLLSDPELKLEFGDIWFNGFNQVGRASRSVLERDLVSARLSAGDVPWNLAFGGEAVVTPPAGYVTLRGEDGPRITLLSPGIAQLKRLQRDWARASQLLEQGESENVDRARRKERQAINIERLARLPFRSDRSLTNGSSIALLVENRGASVVLAADAHPRVFGKALAQFMVGNSYRGAIDAIKVSHHGSRGNTIPDLMNFEARYYLISTDSSIFCHPDDEAIARIIVYSHVEPTIAFNYESDITTRWRDMASHAGRYPFRAEYPPAASEGYVLHLDARDEPG